MENRETSDDVDLLAENSRRFALRLLWISVLLAVAGLSSYAQGPSPTPTPPSGAIFVVDLKMKNGELKLGEPKKITDFVGYNNQPFFMPDGRSVLYTSIRGKQADIYRYDLRSSTTSQVTNTAESEYSPTLMPDRKSISVIRVEADGTQRLWKFPLAGGSPSLILANVKPVGYHCWIDDHTLALFILGGAGKPNTLQIVDTRTEKTETVADNPGRTLRLVPREHKLSFVHKVSNQEWFIKTFDLKTRETTSLIKTLSGVEDYAWTPSGILLMAKDATLYKWEPVKDKAWQELANFSGVGVRRITRIAISPQGNWLAFVAQ